MEIAGITRLNLTHLDFSGPFPTGTFSLFILVLSKRTLYQNRFHGECFEAISSFAK